MLHIRTTKTTSSAIAVQVVKYVNRKMQVLVHIGSAHNKEELQSLKTTAAKWIEKFSKQKSLFPSIKNQSSPLIPLRACLKTIIRQL